MRFPLPCLALLLPLATLSEAALPAAGAAAKTPPASPLALAPGAKRGVLSPEGRTIAAKIYGAPDPHIADLQTQLTTLRQDRTALIAATPIDLDKLEPMLRQEETLSTELRARSNDRLMQLLRALPEADREVVLQNMTNPARPQSSAPAKAGN